MKKSMNFHSKLKPLVPGMSDMLLKEDFSELVHERVSVLEADLSVF